MPRTVSIEWVDHEGLTHVRELSLRKVLRNATGSGNEALVFEIGPFDDVLVSLENREHGSWPAASPRRKRRWEH